jgi:RNA polymerase sigma factor for flagellar operon FliA
MDGLKASDDEPRALWAQFAQSRQPATRERLIELYLPFARTIAARTYRMRTDDSVPFNDYLQYARTGLIEAIDRYDPIREASFRTYSAYRIRGAVLNGLARESEEAAQRHHRRMRLRERMESLQGRETADNKSADTGADLLDLASLTVGLAIGFMLDAVDEPVDESARSNPYAATELAQLRRMVTDAVGTLPEAERRVIESHYFDGQQFQWVATRLGVTKGRISQLHGQALARIRKLIDSAPEIDREA